MNSGFAHLQIPEPVFGGTFPAIIQYPTAQSPAGVTVGPFTWEATLDAPLTPGRFPICVISHGAGGSHLLYGSIATHRGPVARFGETMNYTFGTWLPRSKFVHGDGPNLDRQDERSGDGGNDSEFDFLMPVRPK